MDKKVLHELFFFTKYTLLCSSTNIFVFAGYLATMAGLAGGADAAYIPEENYGIQELMKVQYPMKTVKNIN